jgi:hypothetical protein
MAKSFRLYLTTGTEFLSQSYTKIDRKAYAHKYSTIYNVISWQQLLLFTGSIVS